MRTKTFLLTTSRKTTMTCAENVLTLTPECFHRRVFLLPLHSSLISVFSLYSVFSLISLFSLTLPCVLKRFPLTTSRKTTTMCAENVLTLTPECFHRHVFCCLCIRPSSLLSLFTLLRPHSTRPISLSLFSVISIDPFSLFARSPLLLCFL